MAERLKLQGARILVDLVQRLEAGDADRRRAAPPAIHSYRNLVNLVDRLRDTRLSDMEAKVPLTFVATWPTQMRQAPPPRLSTYCW